MTGARLPSVAAAVLACATLAAPGALASCPEDCPFDLEAVDGYDSNGFPLNPRWHGQQKPGVVLDPAKECEYFSEAYPKGKRQCTQHAVTLDGPKGLKKAICGLSGGRGFKGHINWAPATFVEKLEWTKIALDGDYNWDLRPVEGRILTANRRTLHTEAHGRETINRFQTSWWRDFIAAYHKEKLEKLRDKFAVVSGYLNLDNVHGAYTELHPIYVLAILIEREPAESSGFLRDFWVVFLRNWGNQGFCSSRQHYLTGLPAAECGEELSDEKCHWLGVDLPLPGVLEARLDEGTVLKSNLRLPDADVSVGTDLATIRFVLPEQDPAQKTPLRRRPIVHGEVHVVWRPESLASAMAPLDVGEKTAAPSGDSSQPTEETLFAFLYSQRGEELASDPTFLALPEEELEATVDIGVPLGVMRKAGGPAEDVEPVSGPSVVSMDEVRTEKDRAQERRELASLCEGANRTLNAPGLLEEARLLGIDPGGLERAVDACRQEQLID